MMNGHSWLLIVISISIVFLVNDVISLPAIKEDEISEYTTTTFPVVESTELPRPSLPSFLEKYSTFRKSRPSIEDDDIDSPSDANVEKEFGMEDPDLFQGDILSDFPQEGKTAVRIFQLWPLAIIPYSVDFSNLAMIGDIRAAMNEIEEKTCIRFRPRILSRDYINIGSGSGCYSAVGRQGGPQVLSLGRGCHSHNTILHELLHAIGFEHMHSHRDRDIYLKIRFENIPRDKWRQFEVISLIGYKTIMPFDFESVMLYGPRTFSDRPGVITMESKLPGKRVLEMSEKRGLSPGDIEAINKLYLCGGRRGSDGFLGR